jgi:hypothetical protein
MRNPLRNSLLLAALALVPAARGGYIYLAAQSGPTLLRSDVGPINWGTTNAGSYTVTSPDELASVWIAYDNTVGLTNTLFTCTDTEGCSGFGFTFMAAGWDQSAATFALSGSHTHSGDVQALYLVSVSGPAACPILDPIGSILLSSTFSEERGPFELMCPPPSPVNMQVFWLFTPAGGGAFAPGTTLELPGSLELRGVVPEPGTAALAALGVLGLLGLRRARRRA